MLIALLAYHYASDVPPTFVGKPVARLHSWGNTMKYLAILSVLAMLAAASPLAAQVMSVERNATVILTGAIDNVGSDTGNSPMLLTYTIRNTDAVNALNLVSTAPPPDRPVEVTSVSIKEGNIVYTLTQPAAASIPASGTTTFTINITPSGDGAFKLNVSIYSDDPASPYIVYIRGNTGTLKKKKDEDCSTSDSNRMGLLAILGVLSAGVVAVRFRKARA